MVADRRVAMSVDGKTGAIPSDSPSEEDDAFAVYLLDNGPGYF